MKKFTLQQLTVLAFCIMLGLCVKKVVSPFTNVFTDFFRIPGGSAATGFSLSFIALGCSCAPVFGAGTLMGFTQGLLAMVLGMSSYQGVFCVITYTLPGIMIDLAGKVCRRKDIFYFVLACAMGNVSSAVISNILVFRLGGTAFVLWLLLAVCSGILGGFISHLVYDKVWRVIRKGGIVNE